MSNKQVWFDCPNCYGDGFTGSEDQRKRCECCNGQGGHYLPESEIVYPEGMKPKRIETEPITEFTLGKPHGASFHAWRGRR